MDTNSGRFVDEREAESWMKRIQVGEVVKVKGEEFEVLGFQGREIRLKLLSVAERLPASLAEMANSIAAASKSQPRFPKTPRKAR